MNVSLAAAACRFVSLSQTQFDVFIITLRHQKTMGKHVTADTANLAPRTWYICA